MSKPQWSHMLECKQRMVNHHMELLELFLEEFNIFMQHHPSLRAFRQLSTLEPTSTHNKHSKVTLSEWNIGLLDGLNRLHQVPGLQLEYWWLCTTWVQTVNHNMELLELFLEEFNMFV
ncbi:hypothetical protein DFH27DRAFT_618917 [Peziza echinospora]|nr:hypothetical protein DFH27DRAFT_618917 [Peziza echinospora]